MAPGHVTTRSEQAALTSWSFFSINTMSGAGAQRQTAQSLLSPLSSTGALDDGRSEDTISIAGSIDETPKGDKSRHSGQTPLKVRGLCRFHDVMIPPMTLPPGSPLMLPNRPADPRRQRPQVPRHALEQHQKVHGV